MTLRKISMAALGLVTLAATSGFASGPPTPSWQLSETGVTARFRGLAPVSDKVAWVAGSAGTILRTVDGARSWQRVDPPGTAALQFRDIEAFDADHAVALTIGEGDQSRIYATADGGRTWTETFRNDDPAAFYDCVTFLDRRHGLALSDPVGGKFRILATADGGRSWRVRPTAGMPDALAGEFAFAASGTCLVSADRFGAGRAWFATGGGERARVFTTVNGGRSWRVTDSTDPERAERRRLQPGLPRPVARHRGRRRLRGAGPGPGRGGHHPRRRPHLADREGGAGRVPVGRGVAGRPDGARGRADRQRPQPRRWPHLARVRLGSFDAVLCVPRACWASGEQGRVAKLTWRR